MALYAIGDLHLSFGTNKPMDVFGGGWRDYTEKIKNGFAGLNPDDVCVLCGDISWGMNLEESLEDFRFIDNLPGKKIILKGNHDYWWNTVTKMNIFFTANRLQNISILHNNCYYYEGVAICGTRGWFAQDEFSAEHNAKVMANEVLRLQLSLEAVKDTEEKICFFHYPPRFNNVISYGIISKMNDFNVKKCYYGHIHGEAHKQATLGTVDGIDYEMVSADFIDFTPRKVLG